MFEISSGSETDSAAEGISKSSQLAKKVKLSTDEKSSDMPLNCLYVDDSPVHREIEVIKVVKGNRNIMPKSDDKDVEIIAVEKLVETEVVVQTSKIYFI